MIYYAVQRLAAVPIVLLAVSVLIFTALRAIPGDAALILSGVDASDVHLQDVRKKLGLDRPVYIQYGLWVWRLLHGDFGLSIVTAQPAAPQIVERYLNTLQLTASAMILAIPVGVVAGLIAGVRANTKFDYGTMVAALIGVSIPAFWLGMILILAFSVHLGWFPVGGKGTLRHLVLPAVTQGFFSVGLIARMTRSSVLEVLREEFVRVARAKGLSERSVILVHVLRNALLPVMTVVGLQFGYGMAGAVITENVFAWPGVGRLLVDSIFRRDYPVVQGSILFIASTFVLVNLCVDLLYGLADPRIKHG